MKKSYLVFLLAAGVFFQCSDKGKENENSTATEKKADVSASGSESTDEQKADNGAICIFDNVSLRETPEEKGKYITSVKLAEKLTLLNETKEVESGGKKVEYTKVKLIDGKEGWMRKDFVGVNSKAGVMINDIEIYARPELISKTNKVFKKMDIVGVSDCQSDWCKITGKRTGGTWIESGWVKASDISYSEKDIAVAIFGKQALGIAAADKKLEELRKIVANKDFEGSIFLSELQMKIEELSPEENYEDGGVEEEMEEAEPEGDI